MTAHQEWLMWLGGIIPQRQECDGCKTKPDRGGDCKCQKNEGKKK